MSQDSPQNDFEQVSLHTMKKHAKLTVEFLHARQIPLTGKGPLLRMCSVITNLAPCQCNESIVNSVYVLVFEGVPFYHLEAGRRKNLSGFVLSMKMKC